MKAAIVRRGNRLMIGLQAESLLEGIAIERWVEENPNTPSEGLYVNWDHTEQTFPPHDHTPLENFD